mgnify:FL=1|jgi:hypothetical protein|tara:strand:- start:228 stop:446 length:219 start_codon:yes stop_codon:yes gene_type:complete
MRTPISKHKPWPGKVYTYFVVDNTGHDVHAGLPSIEDCWLAIDLLKSQNTMESYSIEVEQVSSKIRPRIGRD